MLPENDSTEHSQPHVLTLRFHVDARLLPAFRAFLRKAIPYYQSLPGARVRVLRDKADPSSYLEIIEYTDLSAFAADDERVRADTRMKTLLQEWRALLSSSPLTESFVEVTPLLLLPDGE